MLFRPCTCFKGLTCGENSLDHFAPQGSAQRLEFHRVLGRRAQLCQAVGSCLGVQDDFLWGGEKTHGNLSEKIITTGTIPYFILPHYFSAIIIYGNFIYLNYLIQNLYFSKNFIKLTFFRSSRKVAWK